MMRRTSRLFSIVLLAFLVTGMLLSVCAYAQENETEKYVKEARFCVGESREEAAAWLLENGYEPILAETGSETSEEDLPGSGSLVLGIKRTADPGEALADFGFFIRNSQDVTKRDEWTALYTVPGDDGKDPILADSIIIRYGEGKMPEGSTKMLTLTPFESSESEKASETVCLFWNTEQGAKSQLPASSFSGGSYILIAAAGLMIGIIGTTIFLLPKRKQEEQIF